MNRLHTGNIADIIARTISEYDLKADDGQSPTDDLYMIRSSQLDELSLTAALRISEQTAKLERKEQQP
ncbi:hypothetical protein CSQ85_01460 [Bifidobacterium rousetti]|uniref:hypothetical protein n=1 Tax=Bifidobacterium rousetti TaxID=2045439 RepID=UPI00123ABCC2|nr:hypothetical protein [Bifidobacterium rousetti]KAA8820480.1 hypothetical protein CSQ85_01460 [Bifidobacterium rousetti]